VFDSRARACVAEAPSYGRPIARYSPESRGAQAYQALAGEVLRRRGPSRSLLTPAAAVDA
jgi:chromosome partitioning protein